ncbi:glutamate racemase [Helicobacter felis]|uniref:Glutamate racemase n=1 Tax=Helicobacter felis (strain ATCC 49179 / CCUG 28539 / NCTC 12436 / CS1) TaxID=936155 RepID=E7AAR5_HELFC|nr:glutamate racemase [Helicobacter felis]CBY82736.1 glutamate racemase [Helicobacter felis ATCC 49179]
MRVGIFDSGVGGLSVLKSVLQARLFAEIIYYGDTARVPYGPKDKATIEHFALEALEFFKPYQIEMLIVACNTVSALALEKMRAHSSIPIVGVIEAGILATIQQFPNKHTPILVLGTRATIASGQYAQHLSAHGYSNVQSLATGLFVPLIEEGVLEGALLRACMQHYFENIQNAPTVLILGCTHFPLIASSLQNYFQTRFNHPCALVHSGDAIVHYLQDTHHLIPLNHPPQVRFFASGDVKTLKVQAKAWLEV